MNHPLIALALYQAESDNSMWIILAVILVILFFIVVVIAIAVAIFLIMRKRKKAQGLPAVPAMPEVSEPAFSAGFQQQGIDTTPPFEPAPPPMDIAGEETRWPSAPDMAAVSAPAEPEEEFDPSRTVAIVREPTVVISYGKIKFVSGVLAGEEFPVEPDGSYIGREPTLSRIVVSDPRISKRHLWIGVRDGAVTIVDQESRNGTFINDPRSERVHEARLNSGDTVIMGESDVARFEYHQD